MESKFLYHTACIPEGQENDGEHLVIDKTGRFQSVFHLSPWPFGLLPAKRSTWGHVYKISRIIQRVL